jgi:5-methylcytosine-specific restriction enzyme A
MSPLGSQNCAIPSHSSWSSIASSPSRTRSPLGRKGREGSEGSEGRIGRVGEIPVSPVGRVTRLTRREDLAFGSGMWPGVRSGVRVHASPSWARPSFYTPLKSAGDAQTPVGDGDNRDRYKPGAAEGPVPLRPRAPCSTPNCRNLQPCALHTRKPWRDRGQGYDDAAWRRRRAQVLAEEPWCRECLAAGRREPTTTIDHIKARAWGGTDERGNLQGLCKHHQQRKASREGAQGRARRARR